MLPRPRTKECGSSVESSLPRFRGQAWCPLRRGRAGGGDPRGRAPPRSAPHPARACRVRPGVRPGERQARGVEGALTCARNVNAGARPCSPSGSRRCGSGAVRRRWPRSAPRGPVSAARSRFTATALGTTGAWPGSGGRREGGGRGGGACVSRLRALLVGRLSGGSLRVAHAGERGRRLLPLLRRRGRGVRWSAASAGSPPRP